MCIRSTDYPAWVKINRARLITPSFLEYTGRLIICGIQFYKYTVFQYLIKLIFKTRLLYFENDISICKVQVHSKIKNYSNTTIAVNWNKIKKIAQVVLDINSYFYVSSLMERPVYIYRRVLRGRVCIPV